MTDPDAPLGSDLYYLALAQWPRLTSYEQTQVKALATTYLQRYRPLKRPQQVFKNWLDTLAGRVLAESHQSVVAAHPRPRQGDDTSDLLLDLWLTINAELLADLWPIVGRLIALTEPPRQEPADPAPRATRP